MLHSGVAHILIYTARQNFRMSQYETKLVFIFLKIVSVYVCLSRAVCVYLNSFLFAASFENGKYELSTFVHVQGFKGYLFWTCCMNVRISLLISIRRKKAAGICVAIAVNFMQILQS